MLIRIVHEPTGEEFFFRFRSSKQAANAKALLEEYGIPMFLKRYGYAVLRTVDECR